MPFLNLPFHRLRYEDTQSNKPALIFCHGFGMRAEMFASQLAEFSASHRVITWDQRGHGESPAGHAFTLWDSAKDLLALMDHLGIDQAAIVGASQGGFVGLRTALLAPRRAAAIAVFGSSADAESEATKAAYYPLFREFRASTIFDPPDAVIETMAAICFGGEFDGAVWKRTWQAWNKDQFELAFNALIGRDSIAEQIGAVRCPTLVMHGTKDVAFSVDIGQRIAQRIPDAEFVAVEGGQHFLSLTDSDAVNSTLRSFLIRHSGR
ncbi:pimeloyl-ACP methyl ester carboxylesterase [Bradyrhizobium sp. USDA 4503]